MTKPLDLKSAELFDDLEEERGKEIKHFKVDKSIEELVELAPNNKSNLNSKELYREYEDKVPCVTPRQINDLIRYCAQGGYEHCEKEFGTYISALINNMREEEIEIPVPLVNIGVYNKKTIVLPSGCIRVGIFNKGKIIVNGDALYSVGKKMIGGKIHVHGSVQMHKDIVGNYGIVGEKMQNGIIIVEKESHSVGMMMYGGTIICNGKVEDAGWGMKNGTIILNGICKEVGSEMEGGVIIAHKKIGELLWGEHGEVHLHQGYDDINRETEVKVCYGCIDY